MIIGTLWNDFSSKLFHYLEGEKQSKLLNRFFVLNTFSKLNKIGT